jgi:glycosyltransferase involved in cell wall biosynthesis
LQPDIFGLRRRPDSLRARMNIAHVLTSLEIGGGERLTLDLAGGQAAAGHQVSVVSLAPGPDGPLAGAFRERGVTVQRVAKRRGLDPTLPFRLAARFRRQRVGVVHLHNRLPLIYGAPAGRLAGAVVVHTRHGPRPSGRGQQLLLRGATRLLHAYVAVSPELATLARDRGESAAESIFVIENGIDADRFQPTAERRRRARATLGVPDDAWVVGAVGRFAPEKDYPHLVRAAAPLLGERARLVIVGDGAEMPAVKAAVAAGGVERFVALPGARHDVADLLSAFDVFVLSSWMEGMPLVVLEAMAAGLPVVATAVGGLPKLIADGETGYLVPARDEAALRARLEALRADPAGAAAPGARAQTRACQVHGRDRMVERYLDLYSRLGAVA